MFRSSAVDDTPTTPAILSAFVLIMSMGMAHVAIAQTAHVTGLVRDAAIGAPLSGATVLVLETRDGAATADDGTYRIDLPPGTYTLRVSFIGFRSQGRHVAVRTGEATTVDFDLEKTALRLDEIVVAGSGTPTETKRLGNSVATIDAARVVQRATVTTLNELLQSRVPGVLNVPSSGEQGAGAGLRIRGYSSVSLSQEPVVYIDGIRFDNGGGWEGIWTGFQQPSHLNDINPDDLDRIEILRGAAAAGLYGSDASAGIISITTKEGRQGPPRFSFRSEIGALRLEDRFPASYNYVPAREKLNARLVRGMMNLPSDVSTAEAASRWPGVAEKETGDPDISAAELLYGYAGEGDRILTNRPTRALIETGSLQSYRASVSGGSDGLSYYVSGDYDRSSGSFGAPELDFMRRVSLRGNFGATLNGSLHLRVNSHLIDARLTMPNNGGSVSGYLWNASLALPIMAVPEDRSSHKDFVWFPGAGPYGELASPFSEVDAIETTQDKTRFVGNVRLTYGPGTRFRNELLVGVDAIDEEQLDFIPLGAHRLTPDGERTNISRTTTTYTVEDRATYRHHIGGTLTLKSMAGVQAVARKMHVLRATGKGFATPELATITGAAKVVASESREDLLTGGLFFQEQIGVANHAFFTLGGRVDASNAFGKHVGPRIYPKVGMSYVPTDAEYWPRLLGISSLRLRAALGRSGLSPEVFDYLRSYVPQSVQDDLPGLAPGNFGNPDLKPSLATEIETGFDAGFMNDRIGVDVTYYTASTINDLVPVRPIPSLGFTRPQLFNIGEIASSGLELSINVVAFRTPSTSLRVNAFVSTSRSKIRQLSTGDLPAQDMFVGFTQQHREGYAPGSFFVTVLDPHLPYEIDVNANGVPNEDEDVHLLEDIVDVRFNRLKTTGASPVDSLVFAGDPNPDLTGSLSVELKLFKNLRAYAQLDWVTGHKMFNSTEHFRWDIMTSPWLHLGVTKRQAEIQQELYDGRTTVVRKRELLEELTTLTNAARINYVEDAGFAKLREVSLTYLFPSSLSRKLRVRSASFRIAARNLRTWSRYSGPDPEVNGLGRDSFSAGTDFFTLPQVRRVTTALRIDF